MGERENREAWERARTIAAILIQPHVKKGTKVRPQQLISLPWDKPHPRQETEARKLTSDEKRKRFEEVASRSRGRNERMKIIV